MKNYFTRNINKIVCLGILIVVVFSLVSCRTNASLWYDKPYTTWAADFHFVNSKGEFSFGQAFLGVFISVLSYPFAWLMGNIGRLCGNSYFWGIVFATLIIRTIAWPIYAKQNSTTVKMSMIQPEMQKIQRKYAGRTDRESQQRMSQETMKLYKKYHMNPFGCAFTMILQFPIFMAMYECVRRIQVSQTTIINGVVETVKPGVFTLSNTKLFNYFEINSAVMNSGTSGVVKATAVHDIIFGVVVALLFSGITILSQKLSQKQPSYVKKRPREVQSQQQEQQQRMMKTMSYVMTIMFFFMALSSTALAVYWLIGGIYQLFQSQVGRIQNERKYKKMQARNGNIIDSK